MLLMLLQIALLLLVTLPLWGPLLIVASHQARKYRRRRYAVRRARAYLREYGNKPFFSL